MTSAIPNPKAPTFYPDPDQPQPGLPKIGGSDLLSPNIIPLRPVLPPVQLPSILEGFPIASHALPHPADTSGAIPSRSDTSARTSLVSKVGAIRVSPRLRSLRAISDDLSELSSLDGSDDPDDTDDDDDDDDNPGGTPQRAKIPKPKGEAGRPGSGGYNLVQALNWEPKDFFQLKVNLQVLAALPA
jgi:hypothetical protein